VGYTSVLRLEQQALWFEDFLRRYKIKKDMDDFTSNGNLVFSAAINSSSLVANYVSEIVGDRPWPGKIFETAHHRGSASQITQYYTPQIAATVTKLFHDDFVMFGYPLWDGNPKTFRYV
jgi:hypothetical protein